MFTIEAFCETEDCLIKNALKDYGEIYTNTNDIILFVNHFIEKGLEPEAWIFIGFLTQVQKSLLLALISALRKHEIQSLMMIRYALESAVLASYSLFNKDVDSYGNINLQGSMEIKDGKPKKKHYDWLEQNYKQYSDAIKQFKEYINSNSAHANFGPIFNNIDFSTPGFVKNNLFDDVYDREYSLYITMQRLCWIGHVSIALLRLFGDVIEKYPLVKLADDFKIRLSELGIKNEIVREQLSKNPMYINSSSK